MADHRRRFERWRKGLPKTTSYLVDQVLARIVPEFEARGFVWYPDFAGGDIDEVGSNEIPLQRRVGRDWPTGQIAFGKYARPCFSIEFAMLPPECRRLGVEPVPQQNAIVVYAPAYFMLCRGERRNLDGQFGYRYPVLRPRHFLDSEIDKAVSLLPVVFDLFDKGIPEAWLTADFGPIAPHVMLLGSWRIWEERRRKKAASEQERTK